MPAKWIKAVMIAGAVAMIWLALTSPAWAYLDPGTQTQVIQMFSVFLGVLGVWMGILIWPFRKLLHWLEMRFGRRAGWAILGALGVLAISAAAALLMWQMGKGGDAEEDKKVSVANYTRPDRVIVIGMGGLDPTLITTLMDRGELPNFDRLRKSGSFLPLETTLPPETPVAWSSIATGCGPGKFGIFEFFFPDPATYRPVLSIYKVNTDNILDKRDKRYLPVRHAKGFWNITSEAGVPTTVVRWPATFPPERVTGHFISGLGVPDVRGGLGRYSFYTTEETEPNLLISGAWHSGNWQEGVLRSELLGPLVAGLAGRKKSMLEVVVRRQGRDSVTLQIGDSPETRLTVGQCSEYIPIRFKPAWGKVVPAMVRAYLVALEPDLHLYVSPPEVDPADPYFPITFPDGFARELTDAIGRYTTLGKPEDTAAMKEGALPPEAFEQILAQLYIERKKQFDYEFKRFDRGLFAFVFDDGDRIQHMFWSTLDKGHPAYKPEFAAQHTRIIPDMYKRMDAVLGEVLASANSHTTILVMSDHGFHTFRTSVSINTWLVDNGYMVLDTPDGRDGQRMFKDVNWSKTRAYALGFTSIFLNLKGREAEGIVQPGAQAQQLCIEIAGKLRHLTDPATGKPVLQGVYLGSESYRGPYANNAPDIVVGYSGGYRAEDSSVLGAAPAEVLAENASLWSGDHLMDPSVVPGILFSNRRFVRTQARTIDIAPTILHSLGIQRPESMEGEPLF